jgi:hypothetical protein
MQGVGRKGIGRVRSKEPPPEKNERPEKDGGCARGKERGFPWFLFDRITSKILPYAAAL